MLHSPSLPIIEFDICELSKPINAPVSPIPQLPNSPHRQVVPEIRELVEPDTPCVYAVQKLLVCFDTLAVADRVQIVLLMIDLLQHLFGILDLLEADHRTYQFVQVDAVPVLVLVCLEHSETEEASQQLGPPNHPPLLMNLRDLVEQIVRVLVPDDRPELHPESGWISVNHSLQLLHQLPLELLVHLLSHQEYLWRVAFLPSTLTNALDRPFNCLGNICISEDCKTSCPFHPDHRFYEPFPCPGSYQLAQLLLPTVMNPCNTTLVKYMFQFFLICDDPLVLPCVPPGIHNKALYPLIYSGEVVWGVHNNTIPQSQVRDRAQQSLEHRESPRGDKQDTPQRCIPNKSIGLPLHRLFPQIHLQLLCELAERMLGLQHLLTNVVDGFPQLPCYELHDALLLPFECLDELVQDGSLLVDGPHGLHLESHLASIVDH